MDKIRIRIRIPSGAEFEAEGTEELVLSEKEKFIKKFANDYEAIKNTDLEIIGVEEENQKKLNHQNSFGEIKVHEVEQKKFGQPDLLFSVDKTEGGIEPKNAWETITRKGKNQHLVIISKDKSINAAEAVLILLAAEQQLSGNFEIPALILSGMLKSSGFQARRLDRLLQQYIDNGYIKYTGTKRGRAYSLSEKGFQKAALLAHIMIKP